MKRFMRMLVLVAAVAITFTTNQIETFATSDTSAANGEGETTAKPDGEKTEEEKKKEAEEAYKKELEAEYKSPVQSNELKGWPKGPGTYGGADIIMDAGSGAILYAKNIDAREFPASITKVLTALIALRDSSLTDNVVISPECLECLGSGYASIGMKEGNVISMEQALYAMLLASSNEVAHAVGETVAEGQGQDYAWFLAQMNETAKELGAKESNFVNTNGVHDENHYTSARDMALIAKELFDYPEFSAICQTQQYTIPASATTEEHVFQQKHEMLLNGDKEYYEYAVGGKTGYTTEASNTLVTLADNGELQLVCVALKTYGGHVYTDTKALFEYGFENFKKVTLEGTEKSSDIESFEDGAYVVLPKDVDFKDLDREIIRNETGGREATVTYTYKDMPVGTAQVTVSEKYGRQEVKFSEVDKDKADAEKEEEAAPLLSNTLKVVLVAAAVVLVIMAVLISRANQRRRRNRRRRRPPR